MLRQSPYPRYRKSRWPATSIPNSWVELPLKHLCTVNDSVLPENTDSAIEIDYVDIGSVNLTEGIARIERVNFGDSPSRARRLARSGDIIVSTVRTYLRAIAPVRNEHRDCVFSTGFAVIRPRKVNSGFAQYALQCQEFVDQVVSRSVGVSYPAINASDLVSIPIPVPNDEEQEAIARFLAHETARIDELIAKQQRLIELLKEKRQAVISHAVTKGLHPDAPMKDSGVEWLGQMPAHWQCGSLGYFSKASTGGTPDRAKPEYWNGNIPWIKTGEVRFNWIESAEESITPEGIANSAAYIARPETVLVAMYGQGVTRGRAAILGVAAAFNQACAAISAGHQLQHKFLFYSLRAAYGYLRDLGNETSQANLNLDVIRKLRLPVPPIKEQAKIVRHLELRIPKIDAAEDAANRSIELLLERRTALISAAVTGKIDVRDWQPPQAGDADAEKSQYMMAAEERAGYG